MKKGKVLLGVLGGMAAGAALGILFAPDKGTNTRRKIATKSNEYIDSLETRYNKFVDSLSSRFDSMKEGSATAENGKLETKHETKQFESMGSSSMGNSTKGKKAYE